MTFTAQPMTGLSFLEKYKIKTTSFHLSTCRSGTIAHRSWTLWMERFTDGGRCAQKLSCFAETVGGKELDWDNALCLLSRGAAWGQLSWDGYITRNLGAGEDIVVHPGDYEDWVGHKLLWLGVQRLLNWEVEAIADFLSIGGGHELTSRLSQPVT